MDSEKNGPLIIGVTTAHHTSTVTPCNGALWINMWNPYCRNIHIHKVSTKFATTQNKCVVYFSTMHSMKVHKIQSSFTICIITLANQTHLICRTFAAYLADDADVPICCARWTFHLEDSTLVPILPSLSSVSRYPTGCPKLKNLTCFTKLSHIFVICSSIMNRHIRKFGTEFETSYRNCILWCTSVGSTYWLWMMQTDLTSSLQ